MSESSLVCLAIHVGGRLIPRISLIVVSLINIPIDQYPVIELCPIAIQYRNSINRYLMTHV